MDELHEQTGRVESPVGARGKDEDCRNAEMDEDPGL